MYSFQPSAEQEKLIETSRRFAADEIRPAARAAEEDGQLPSQLIARGWELGLSQMLAEQGEGAAALDSVLAFEELAHGDLADAIATLLPNLWLRPLIACGSEGQCERYLPLLASDRWQPYSSALIEKRFDFDPHVLQTQARREGGGYVLNGAKAFVPFAERAPAILVYAEFEGRVEAFAVEAGLHGLRVGRRQKLLGLSALPLYELHLGGVQVPAEARLGGEAGLDFEPLLASMRVANAALAVGLARAAYEYARDYAKEREVFGSKVAQKQSIAFMLAEMATEIEAMRLLTWEAAWQLDMRLSDAAHSAYLAAQGAADMARMVTDRAVQTLGGHGYVREHPVELWMRNAGSLAALTGLAMV